jgi:hypothetical protein
VVAAGTDPRREDSARIPIIIGDEERGNMRGKGEKRLGSV